MKKVLLTLSLALASAVGAQFSSGTVSLGSTGMTVKLDTSPTLVTITLTGADTSYLGIGFGNVGEGMQSGKDGFIYNSTANRDYTFANVGVTPNADATQDWTQTSNTTSGGIRTVVATRSLSGGAGDNAIANSAGNINIFFAKGPTTDLLSGYHGGGNRGYVSLNMTATLGTNDLALESKKIVLYPNPAKETVNFKNADKIKSIDIYESTGRKIKSVKIDGENINVADLKAGSYYFEIKLKDGTLSYEKLIKE
ncbi:T9SS type A sorting domain-containing protein [Chryseobacterium limigenitum]|uniref:Por secretion system C-terminal sorting domain-containing protein n=1 Tax=Chryseobacterium limigenitum TaxID=1612149 RepID=A0A1K2IVE8_9FLAO|nr:T9SS type A sorting domain-containing protein [Chryseobacterium limigenitum]SFZ96397.1 Por secretion system C-terminal sorting domain-containing protein [Chryseobacterium limigenitum]